LLNKDKFEKKCEFNEKKKLGKMSEMCFLPPSEKGTEGSFQLLL